MNKIELKAYFQAMNQSTPVDLNFTQQKDKTTAADGTTIETPTPWHSAWIPTSRIRVTMHQEVLNSIVANPARTDLVVKPKQVVAAHGETAEYTRYIVVIPTGITLSL